MAFVPLFMLALAVVGAEATGNYSCPGGQLAGVLFVPGSGSATGQPDVAKVSLTVSSTKDTAKEARDEAALASSEVNFQVGALNGIRKDDITTLDVSLTPNYVWNDKTETQNITGYTFSQRMQVKVANLTNEVLASVIDTAVRAGGDNVRINSIQAELSPELKQDATNEARSNAVEDALAAANALAKAARVSLGPIKTFAESLPLAPIPYTISGADASRSSAPVPTPINIGTSDVTSSVSMEFYYCNP